MITLTLTSSLITELTSLSTNHENKTTNHGLVVIDFFATWCDPCKEVEPVVAKFPETYPSVTFAKIDEAADKFSISGMPTFLFMKRGKTVDTVLGANLVALENKIKEHYDQQIGHSGAFPFVLNNNNYLVLCNRRPPQFSRWSSLY
ncbi:unnamed protein product [Echinostoma caproni]|uniref:Thioredoxin domain-containing protein n=1 Tax=Echinostoma caproni TaxID=27848 RepID=A0A183AW32_9TREM|nr:unnamed protein product [Echinostoma caproni]